MGKGEERDCEAARKASAKAIWWPSLWRREVEPAEPRNEYGIAENGAFLLSAMRLRWTAAAKTPNSRISKARSY